MNIDICKKCCEKNGKFIDFLYISSNNINFIAKKPITKTTKVNFYACAISCKTTIPKEYRDSYYYSDDSMKKILNHLKISKNCPFYTEHEIYDLCKED